MTDKKAFVLWLLTILFWGISPIIEKLGLRNVDPLPALFIRTSVSAVIMLVIILAIPSVEISSITKKDFFILALSGIIGGFLGMYTYFSLLKTKAASKVVPLTSTYPLVATILGILILKEKLTLSKLIGTILVVIGIFFLFR